MADDEVRQQEFGERLLDAMVASAELLTIELGRRLGLYQALAGGEPADAPALARRAGIAERYAREWLEQQAAAGILEVAPTAAADVGERAYHLPAAIEPLLLDPEHPAFLMGVPPLMQSIAATLPAVETAFREGGGVAYAAFGPELRYGIAALNRPGYTNDLRSWIEALPDVAERLAAGGTVLDAGSGVGWSTIALARAFPEARVIGVDLDAASVAEATANAAGAGVPTDRLRFETVDAAGYQPGTVDLVTVFEALHDMADPVGVLAGFRRALAPGGAVLVADEKVADEFVAPAGADERLQYAISVLHCLPATMAEKAAIDAAGGRGIANGTVLRAPTVRRWAREAGFDAVTELSVDHRFWRFYRLD
ncbi:class I SAM-dependent methyltransferase [Herbiconiux daphne]|uniref:Class I SAM-dependent methyltransferase n=1 Tax=Herbiconiux daphne TaxID=2970914 RepID=A0ABT2H8J7_9MICO|nr:class I SAM-dependent methyltransferase [Herbiconiux daphne]MCS5736264.1 class I SAM-dependent methyltransferase [Herbiconiux daphne]